MVPIQLKIFTPVGMAMIIVDEREARPRPPAPARLVNMWCDHTPQPMNPMAMPENTTNA